MAYGIPFDVPEWTYTRALGRLHECLRLGISPMLETVEDMLAELGDPDLAYECVQVAGTNGKTSTARYTAAILRGEGFRTALYTSPELVNYTERMEIDGHPVSEGLFARGIAAAAEAGRRVNQRRSAAGERPYDITEFDLLTVGAHVMFALSGVEVTVLEVGMGGRWDATTATKSIKAVTVTGIGLDHTHILGDTLEAIAAEKAAVIKPGMTCVLGVGTATPHSVEDVFLDRCTLMDVVPTLLRPEDPADALGEMHPGTMRTHAILPRASYCITAWPERIGAPLQLDVTTPRTTYQRLSAPKPSYQAANIACAITLAEAYLGRELNRGTLPCAIESCPTPGRFDLVRSDPAGLIDACHNPQSVEAFLTAVREVAPNAAARPTLLAAVLADKDVQGIVDLLAPEFPQVVVTQTQSARALPAEELAQHFKTAGAKVAGTYPSVSAALEALADTPFIACGSITLAGEVAALLRM